MGGKREGRTWGRRDKSLMYSTDAVKVPVLLFTEPKEKTVVSVRVFWMLVPFDGGVVVVVVVVVGVLLGEISRRFSSSENGLAVEDEEGGRAVEGLARGDVGCEFGYGAELETVGVEKREYCISKLIGSFLHCRTRL